ncbi:MAG TPA: PadR family transcriptional regulator, partial [Micrococcaceae bacterium]
MSIRHSLLALLQDGPRYGYQLRSEFEERTGATWPLNIGQVYTTLDRLERDGLVRNDGGDGDGHVIYSITDAGLTEV